MWRPSTLLVTYDKLVLYYYVPTLSQYLAVEVTVVRDLLLADVAHEGPAGTGHPVATFLLEELQRKPHF